MPPPAPVKSPTFDRRSFLKYVKNIGRPYRKQAKELISISRAFVVVQEPTSHPCDELESALQLIDDALTAATDAGKTTSKDADDKFKKAINALIAYEKSFHSKEIVAEKMEKAEAYDKSSSTILNRLKENFRPLVEEPKMIVKFLLHKSLPDTCPTIVTQALCQSSNLNEILWNFSRYKDEKRRLTLKQKPHFYEVLPTRSSEYGGEFRAYPVETFQHERISVLTDDSGKAGRVYLETAEKKRVFGRVWIPEDAIIFKDIFGTLEGESLIGSFIQDTPNLWCFEEPSPSYPSRPSLSPGTLNSPSPTATATPTTSSTGGLIGDWKEPIRRMTYLLDFNIWISPRPPDFSPSYSTFPSPSPPSGSSISIDTRLSINVPQSRDSRLPITIQIPGESSTGPSSPSSFMTARSTPLSQQRPEAELSPRLRAPLSPELALPSPTTCPLLHPDDITSPQEVTVSGDTIPSPAFITAVPSPIARTAITFPLQVISPIVPHAESDEDEDSVGHDPSQFSYSIPEDEDVSDDGTVTPTSNTRKRKRRRWYHKCVEVVKRKLRRRVPRGASASTPNLAGHGALL